ncbi:threonine/serine exporter family protein [Faucicola mancuniensis]|uniref:threonine/serine exporter family protein n=1 Tax=Faucicola mancuniensis TaxID=1309795 RepID=UPI0028E7A0BF|nr:threonine/serine exporter family protein [uncultured Moraxella sp.]
MDIHVLKLLEAVFYASLMTLGWSLMVNVPKMHLWKCIVITIVGFGSRNLWLQLGMNMISASFVSAMMMAFLAVYFAKRYLVTPKAVLVPAMLCMMPGVPAYKAMLSLVQLGIDGYNPVLFSQMMDYALNAFFTTLALVFGLSLPSTIVYRKEPIL